MSTFSLARELAVQSIKQAGDWMLVKFPQEETGKVRKLSRPWHGPYPILTLEEPDNTAIKVFFSDDNTIRVHLSRVTPCPCRVTTRILLVWYQTSFSRMPTKVAPTSFGPRFQYSESFSGR